VQVDTVNLPGASGILYNADGCIVVHATRETSGGASAVYRLWDGSSASGTLLLPVSLDASESTRDDFRAHHLPFRTGLYFELVSGTIEGCVSFACDHRCRDALVAEWHATMAAGQ